MYCLDTLDFLPPGQVKIEATRPDGQVKLQHYIIRCIRKIILKLFSIVLQANMMGLIDKLTTVLAHLNS